MRWFSGTTVRGDRRLLECWGYFYDTPTLSNLTTSDTPFTGKRRVSSRRNKDGEPHAFQTRVRAYCTSDTCQYEIKNVPNYVEWCPDCNEPLSYRAFPNVPPPPTWRGKKFECGQCGIAFSNYVECRRHLWQRHYYFKGF